MKNYIRKYIKKLKALSQKNKVWILLIAGFIILIQILFSNAITDLIILASTILLAIGIYLNRLSENFLIRLGLFLIIFCPIFLIFGQLFAAEKLAIWAYIFLFLGLLRKLTISLKQDGSKKKGR